MDNFQRFGRGVYDAKNAIDPDLICLLETIMQKGYVFNLGNLPAKMIKFGCLPRIEKFAS